MERGTGVGSGVVLKIGSEYEDVTCIMCENRIHLVTGAQPTDPFEGTSFIDLKCKECGNETYISTEGYCTAE